MPLPSLLALADEHAYEAHFEREYVRGPRVATYDGVQVRFLATQFRHVFHKDSSRGANDKAVFDLDRARRMDWIRCVLADQSLEVYRRVMENGEIRRIVLHPRPRYVVITQVYSENPPKEVFITAFWVRDPNSRTLANIRSNPRW